MLDVFLSQIRSYQKKLYIIKTQIFKKLNFDLKGHLRSHKVIFVFKNIFFFDIFSFKFVSIKKFLILTYVPMDNFCPCFYVQYVYYLYTNNLYYQYTSYRKDWYDCTWIIMYIFHNQILYDFIELNRSNICLPRTNF